MADEERLVLITWEAIDQIVDEEWEGMTPALRSAVHSLREYTRGMGNAISDLTRELEERVTEVGRLNVAVRDAWEDRFDEGYQMAIEHSLRIVAIAKDEGLPLDAIAARIGLRAPDPTRLSRASGDAPK